MKYHLRDQGLSCRKWCKSMVGLTFVLTFVEVSVLVMKFVDTMSVNSAQNRTGKLVYLETWLVFHSCFLLQTDHRHAHMWVCKSQNRCGRGEKGWSHELALSFTKKHRRAFLETVETLKYMMWTKFHSVPVSNACDQAFNLWRPDLLYVTMVKVQNE